MKTQNTQLQIAFFVGFIGLITMAFQPSIGGLVVLSAAGLVVYGIRTTSAPKKIPPIQRVSSEFEVSHVAPFQKAKPQPDRTNVGILLGALRTGSLDTKAAVLISDQGQTIATVRDVVVEIARIAEEHGEDINEVARVVPDIYSKIWDNTDRAVEVFHDTELILAFVARKSMIDVQWNFKDLPLRK